MKTRILYSVMVLLGVLIVLSCGENKPSTPPEVGTLTAYYAVEDFKVDFSEYKKGQLICDSNDPMNRIVEMDDTTYRYEGDNTGEYYSISLPKSKVKKVTYTMNLLPVSMVGERATFKSEEGDVVRIFKPQNNGHQFFSWDDGHQAVVNAEETKRHEERYVLSTDFSEGSTIYGGEFLLDVKDGNLDLYRNNPYMDGEDTTSVRYRDGLIGIVEESWWSEDGWEGPAYSKEGKLLVDQYEIDGIPSFCSIAYVGELDALYFNGGLFYRQVEP